MAPKGRPRGSTAGVKKRPAAEAGGSRPKRCVYQRAPPSAFRALPASSQAAASSPGFSLFATARRLMRCLGIRVAELGRTLRITTAASGTGAPTHVLEMLLGSRNVAELWASEVSTAAVHFMMRATKPMHIFHGIGSTLSASSQAPCLLHGGAMCRVPAEEQQDLFVMGGPCQPNSALNPGRFEGDAIWPESINPDLDVFYNGVRHIKRYKPSTFIFENVPGIYKRRGGDSSGNVMDYVMDDPVWGLANLPEYSVDVLDVDSADVEGAQQRNRVYIVGIRNHVGKRQRTCVRSWRRPSSLRLLPSASGIT